MQFLCNGFSNLNNIIFMRKKKYRIKVIKEQGYISPFFKVQVRRWFGWVDVKVFYDSYEPDFARLEAEELLEKLNEK